MNLLKIFILIMACYFFLLDNKSNKILGNKNITPHNDNINMADTNAYKAQKLINAYPEKLKAYKDNKIIWHDGTEMLFDDGLKKDFQTLLDKPDLEDQIAAMTYPSVCDTPKPYEDAGRVRFEPFFLKMYGNTAQKVKDSLVEIVWLPKLVNQKISVSRINGVDKKFKAISDALDTKPELAKYLKNIAGTFAWRKISGTDRLSMHSFGVTMDINTAFSNYWQWDNKNWRVQGEHTPLKYTNRIPIEIVKIFEQNGFIWGGKWYHYDSMHFEYRPELL